MYSHRVMYYGLVVGGPIDYSTLVHIAYEGHLFTFGKFLLYSIFEHELVLTFAKVK